MYMHIQCIQLHFNKIGVRENEVRADMEEGSSYIELRKQASEQYENNPMFNFKNFTGRKKKGQKDTKQTVVTSYPSEYNWQGR